MRNAVRASIRCRIATPRPGSTSAVRTSGQEARRPLISPINENWPSRFAAEPVCTSNCGLTYADDGLIAGIVEKVRVLRFEVFGETQHLKAVAITDGPELQLGSVAAHIAPAIDV